MNPTPSLLLVMCDPFGRGFRGERGLETEKHSDPRLSVKICALKFQLLEITEASMFRERFTGAIEDRRWSFEACGCYPRRRRQCDAAEEKGREQDVSFHTTWLDKQAFVFGRASQSRIQKVPQFPRQ